MNNRNATSTEIQGTILAIEWRQSLGNMKRTQSVLAKQHKSLSINLWVQQQTSGTYEV